ncbi:rhodanese-like domain-containing protein [uncultured Winogradskyella sp.]|uniref:rhodanese-like domain-containing protein n=1 Tax=uncultured Winogradskyella sp. TaxID=395353 RepID=UPI0026311F68|nr:rhodanese-like domain-containing protein [uncultured Winogradskyella sp.]
MGLLDILFGKKTNSIETYLDNDAIVLDVRTQKEFDAFHFENVVHIPISELKSRVNEVKQRNKPVIAHCKSGVRSARAVSILKANGIDAINGGGLPAMQNVLQ